MRYPQSYHTLISKAPAQAQKWEGRLLNIKRKQRQIQQQRNPIPVDKEQERQEAVHRGFGDDVGVKAVAKIDGVDIITIRRPTRLATVLFVSADRFDSTTYHSRSEYMIVKKTCRNRFTALISTANRYNHASPDIMMVV